MITEDHKKHFLQLYAIALADDEISPKEIRFLQDFARHKGISEADVEQLLLTPSFTEVHKPETLNEKVEYLYYSTGMALADDMVEKRELAILRSICVHLGFLEENADAIVSFFIEELKKGTSLMDIQAIVKLNMLT